jgi:dienelactone hydrolase
MGFSRGGFLTLQAATEKPEIFDAVVLMAPASVNGALETLCEDLSMVGAPVLVLVSENDLFQDDHVHLVEVVVAGLEAAEKDVTSNIYPPYGTDGHTRFFEVGDYWVDILNFLEPLLAE